MARKAPTGIHSAFKERVVLNIRAPEGETKRSLLMQRLVAEMTERHNAGHLTEWITSTLLEKVESELIDEASKATTKALLDFASNAGSKSGVVLPEPIAQAVAHTQQVDAVPIGAGSDQLPASTTSFSFAQEEVEIHQPAAKLKKPMPSGLKAMG